MFTFAEIGVLFDPFTRSVSAVFGVPFHPFWVFRFNRLRCSVSAEIYILTQDEKAAPGISQGDSGQKDWDGRNASPVSLVFFEIA